MEDFVRKLYFLPGWRLRLQDQTLSMRDDRLLDAEMVGRFARVRLACGRRVDLPLSFKVGLVATPFAGFVDVELIPPESAVPQPVQTVDAVPQRTRTADVIMTPGDLLRAEFRAGSVVGDVAFTGTALLEISALDGPVTLNDVPLRTKRGMLMGHVDGYWVFVERADGALMAVCAKERVHATWSEGVWKLRTEAQLTGKAVEAPAASAVEKDARIEALQLAVATAVTALHAATARTEPPAPPKVTCTPVDAWYGRSNLRRDCAHAALDALGRIDFTEASTQGFLLLRVGGRMIGLGDFHTLKERAPEEVVSGKLAVNQLPAALAACAAEAGCYFASDVLHALFEAAFPPKDYPHVNLAGFHALIDAQ